MSARQTTRFGLALGAALFGSQFSPSSAQQVSFSVDWQSPLVGQPDSQWGFPISEGDVLVPQAGALAFGPLANPNIAFSSGIVPPGLGLAGQIPCWGHLGGTPCTIEVDALSYGHEPLTGPGAPMKYNLAFSVDRLAKGMSIAIPPSVGTEAMCGDAAADAFVDVNLGVGPLAPWMANVLGNTRLIDGDGLVSCSGALYKGVGLREPSSAFPFLPNPGDNLDALAILNSSSFPATGVYFSLDAGFIDPMTGLANTGSAAAHGFMPGDVLYTATPGGAPVVFAPAAMLGLNMAGAFDDLDALILHENGTGVFEPSQTPNDWMSGATDMLLFSVRRGSPVIGQPDSIFGLPIQEGDVLTTPHVGSPSLYPGIYVAAENLGLGSARIVGMIPDDLDALDLLAAPINDCNGNGVDDTVDIALATSWDINSNGVPDECELLTSGFCYCAAPSPAPCGNFYFPGGCLNSSGAGAILAASGTTSVSADNLVLTTTQMPTNKAGILFMSQNTVAAVPFWDGLRCLKAPIVRYPGKNSGSTGSFAYGPGLVAASSGTILAGSTWNFQSWFRDPPGPCSTGANTSNAIQAQFTP
jgi:hypothetical protein